MLGYVLAHAFALGTKHQRHSPCGQGFFQGDVGTPGKADAPLARLGALCQARHPPQEVKLGGPSHHTSQHARMKRRHGEAAASGTHHLGRGGDGEVQGSEVSALSCTRSSPRCNRQQQHAITDGRHHQHSPA